MSKHIEALKLALEALDIVKIHYTQNRHVNEAIKAIKEALTQPEQEPTTFWKEHAKGLQRDYDSLLADFQAQRTWHGLTDKDVSEIVRGTHNTGSFVRAISAKLKQKNGYAEEKNT